MGNAGSAGFGDIGDWSASDWANGLGSGGGNQLLGGTLTNPFSGVMGMAGFTNPSDTEEAKALAGNKALWAGTAALADRRLGTDVNAPQIGQQQRVVVGTDPNGAPIYENRGASVAAPTWQKADVTQAGIERAQGGPQVQAGQMTAAQADAAQANQARDNQNALVSSLQGTAAGQGPSVAQAQLRQSTDANINQQMSAAQSAHGSARLAALRNASMMGAATQQQANAQAAGLRAQEIAAAQGNLGSALGMQRGQDITMAGTNAGFQQQAGMTNATLGQQASTANAQLGQNLNLANATFGNQGNQFNAGAANTAGLNYATQQNQGNLAMTQANLGAQLGTNQLNTQRGIAQVGANQGAVSGATGIDQTLFQGQIDYNKGKQEMAGQGLNSIGQALPALGALL